MKKVDKYFNGGFLMPKRQGGLIAFSKNNQSGFRAPRMKSGGSKKVLCPAGHYYDNTLEKCVPFENLFPSSNNASPMSMRISPAYFGNVDFQIPQMGRRQPLIPNAFIEPNLEYIHPNADVEGLSYGFDAGKDFRKFGVNAGVNSSFLNMPEGVSEGRSNFHAGIDFGKLGINGGINSSFINTPEGRFKGRPSFNAGLKFRFGNGGDISLPNVYPNQMVPKFEDGGGHDCPDGFEWNEQRQACTTPDGRTFEELKASNDEAWSALKSGLLTGAGIAGAAYGIPRFLEHPLVSTIPDVIRTKSYKPYGMSALLATGAKLAPIVSKTPILKNIYKDAAYRVGSQSPIATRDLNQIIGGVFNNKDIGQYSGYNIKDYSKNKKQNLLKKYIYNDNTGFVPSDLKYRGLEKYEKAHGKPFETFKLNMALDEGEPLNFEDILTIMSDDYTQQYRSKNHEVPEDNLFLQHPELLETVDMGVYDRKWPTQDQKKLFEFFKNKGSVYSGLRYPVSAVEPNIAGHRIYFDYNPTTNQVHATTQDLWKFDEVDYPKKWLKMLGVEKTPSYKKFKESVIGDYKDKDLSDEEINRRILENYLNIFVKGHQARLMNNAGDPFVTIDERPLKFDFSDADILTKFSGYLPPSETLAAPPEEIVIPTETITPPKKSSVGMTALEAAKKINASKNNKTSRIINNSSKKAVEKTATKKIDINANLPLRIKKIDLKDLKDFKIEKPLFKSRTKFEGRKFKFKEGGVALNQYYPGGPTSGFGVTDQTTILPNFLKNLNLPVYKVNPWANVTAEESLLPNFLRFKKFESPKASFRIGNQASYQDFLNQGVVRSAPEGAPIELGELGQISRYTGFPSFAQGTFAPSYFSADRAGDVIYKTDIPTFKRGQQNPVTGNTIRGSHWAARPIDLVTGKVVTEVPGSQVEVFGGKPHWLHGYQKVFNPYDPIHAEIAGLKGLQPVVNDYRPQGILEKFMFDYYDNNIQKIDKQIADVEKAEGTGIGKMSEEGAKKINDLLKTKHNYQQQKIQYRDKRATRYADKLAASVPGGGFGESIGVGGFAQGVFPFKDNPDFLMKVGTYPDYENVSELLEKSRPFRGRENISVPLHIAPYPQRPDLYSTVLKRQPGESLSHFENIPRQSVVDAIRKIRELEAAGLKVDFAGDNLLFDPITHNISLIDLGSDYTKLADQNVLANILNQKYDKNIMNVLRNRYSIVPSANELKRIAANSGNPITPKTKPDVVSAVTKPDVVKSSGETVGMKALNTALKLKKAGRTTAGNTAKNVVNQQKVTKPTSVKKVSAPNQEIKKIDVKRFDLKKREPVRIKNRTTKGDRKFEILKQGGTAYDVNSVLDVSEQDLPKMIEQLKKQGYEFKITY